jgi:hypothetical protein
MTALLALLTMLTIGTPCTNGRASPTVNAPVTVCLAPGTSVNLAPDVVHADGYDWRLTDAGVWIASDYLGAAGQSSVLTPPPAPPPPPQAGTPAQRPTQGQSGGGASTTLVPPPSPMLDQASSVQTLAATSSAAPTQTQVVAEIDRQAQSAGLKADCVEALAWRESHDDPSAVNPSGARGLFGWLPDHGEWSSTPLGKAGLSVAQATASQQVAMAVWALLAGDGGGAWGQSDGCRSSSTIS